MKNAMDRKILVFISNQLITKSLALKKAEVSFKGFLILTKLKNEQF